MCFFACFNKTLYFANPFFCIHFTDSFPNGHENDRLLQQMNEIDSDLEEMKFDNKIKRKRKKWKKENNNELNQIESENATESKNAISNFDKNEKLFYWRKAENATKGQTNTQVKKKKVKQKFPNFENQNQNQSLLVKQHVEHLLSLSENSSLTNCKNIF